MDLKLLAGWPVVFEQRMVWGEMDSYGHVNNTVYFRYFENARLEYFRRLGWGAGTRPAGIGPILHSTQCRFRRPLEWPDTIATGARVTKVEADRFMIEHLIVSEKLAAVAAQGWGLIVTFDYAANAKAPVPEEPWVKSREIEGR